MSKIKLIDVAKKAGVSKSTASQFLNGRFDYMSKTTKEKLQEAVKELKYVPNAIARSLKTDKTKIVGVVVRDVSGTYTGQAIRGMDDYCKGHGYSMIIYNTDFDQKTELKAIEALLHLRVDALIIASSGGNTRSLEDVSALNIPVVQFQLEYDESAKNIVLSDYREAAYQATKYLIKLGHQKICFVTQEFSNVRSRLERYLGYQDALQEHSIEIASPYIQYWDRGAGLRNSPNTLLTLEQPPTAFFSQHLAITIDLLTAFEEANISIPDDVSLLGFDDIPMADYFKVPITVLKQNPYKVGQQTAKIAIDQINGLSEDSQRVTVPCELIVRRSCKKV